MDRNGKGSDDQGLPRLRHARQHGRAGDRGRDGAAFGAVVAALVAALVTPLIAAVGGEPDFNALDFEINGSTFRYGHILNALISFLTVAAVVFFLVIRPFNALVDRFATKPPEGRATRECPECLSSIPAAAGRCAFCTAELPRGDTIRLS